jgi:hypothetical protein
MAIKRHAACAPCPKSFDETVLIPGSRNLPMDPGDSPVAAVMEDFTAAAAPSNRLGEVGSSS